MKLPPDFTSEERLAAQWLHRMGKGDIPALDALYGLYHRPLLHLFSVILKDDFAAEEVLQDTFVRVYRAAARYDPQLGTPFAWMSTIGRRIAIDRLRKRRARPVLVANEREQLGHSADIGSWNDDETPHMRVELKWLRESLGELPDPQRQALELAFFDGYTHAEIAGKLGKPLGTVKSDLARGLSRLREVHLEKR